MHFYHLRFRYHVLVGEPMFISGRIFCSSSWHLYVFLTVFTWYEGCSNMNASSFITFVTYMLRQNGIRFYKGLYATFKLAPYLKQNSLDLSSHHPLNEGHFCILTDSMLWTYQWYRRAYSSSINWWNFLKFWKKYPHILVKWFCESCENPTCFC